MSSYTKDELIEKIASRELAPIRHAELQRDPGEQYDSSDDKKLFVKEALGEMLEYWSRPCVTSTEEAQERIAEYFSRCIQRGTRPTVEELALALGTTRATLWRWETGKIKVVDGELISRAKEYIAAFDAKAVTAGKLNPVTYIFRGKNYYGLKDQTDVVVTPNQLETIPKDDLIHAAEMLPEE